MSNIHAPTVPSGPTTVPVANGNASHLTFSELERRKQNVEDEMKALGGVLDSVGYHTRLGRAVGRLVDELMSSTAST